MATLTDFSATGAKIRDLTGSGVWATNLISPSILTNNQFSDLSPVAGLTNLEALDIGDNPLADLSPLAGLTKLEFLDIRGCGISDLAPLAGLTHLINLTLHNNEIADLSAPRGTKEPGMDLRTVGSTV